MKKYYAWAICLGGLILQFWTIGLASNCFGVFLPYFRSELGLLNSQTSTFVTVRCLFGFIGVLLIKKYYEKLDLRLGMAVACFLFGVGLIAWGFGQNFITCIFGLVPLGIAYGFGNMYSVTIALNRWFKLHYGLALSICVAGSGIAAIIMPPVMNSLLESKGLRFTVLSLGIASIVSSLLIFLLVRNTPEEMGLTPFGSEKHLSKAEEKIANHAYSGKSPREIFLFLAVLLFGIVAIGSTNHFSVLFIDLGYTPELAALSVSTFGLCLMIFKLIYGALVDKFGTFVVNTVYFVLGIAGFFISALLCRGSVVMMVLSTGLIGVGLVLTSIGYTMFAKDLYPKDKADDVNQHIQMANMLGGTLFSTLPGIIADKVGSYAPSFFIYGVMMIIIAVSITAMYIRRMNR